MISFIRQRFHLLIWLVVLLVVALVASYVGLLILSRAQAPGPQVRLLQVAPNDPAYAQQTLIVRGAARDAAGLDQVELWVNGDRIAVQQMESQPAMASVQQAWFPTKAGVYSLSLRAINSEGRAGDSGPTVLQVEPRDFGAEAEAPTQVIVQEPMSAEEFEVRYGFAPTEYEGAAEGETVEAGDSLLGPSTEDDFESEPEAAEPPPDSVPVVEPVEVPAAEVADEDIAVRPLWWSLPGADLLCAAVPEVCGGGSAEASIVPAKPTGVTAEAEPNRCTVVVEWTDQSDNELGFNIWRIEVGAGRGEEHRARVMPGFRSGHRLRYVDEHAGRGTFSYIVEAFNDDGSTSMPAATFVETRCSGGYPGAEVPVVVEAVSMEVEPEMDQLYCYGSVGDLPAERIPAATDEFITVEDGSWNIADYFSGENRRRLWVNRETGFLVSARCFGRNSGSVFPLGETGDFIAPHQWDGRVITLRPPEGSFELGIRVFLTTTEEDGGSTGALVDPDIPAPFNLAPADSWLACMPWMTRVSQCPRQEGSALSWDYPPFRLGEPMPSIFRVFKRMPGESDSEQAGRAWHPSHSSGLPIVAEGCEPKAFYSVNAITNATDPVTGEYLESPPSEEIELGADCLEVTVTLEAFWVGAIQDGAGCSIFKCDRTAEAYGRLWVGGQEVVWNNHCHSGLCRRGDEPGSTKTPEGSLFDMANLYLNHGDGWAQNNNRFQVDVDPSEGLFIDYHFKDHDKASGDDNLCFTNLRSPVFAAGSDADWRTMDETQRIGNATGKCWVEVRVQGPEAR